MKIAENVVHFNNNTKNYDYILNYDYIFFYIYINI